jgi:hypothetical protein
VATVNEVTSPQTTKRRPVRRLLLFILHAVDIERQNAHCGFAGHGSCNSDYLLLHLSDNSVNQRLPDEQICLSVGIVFFSFVQGGNALSASLLLLENRMQARHRRAESLVGM